MRVTIGGCDFDLSPWAYNEEPQNDLTLSGFTKLDQRDLDKVCIELKYFFYFCFYILF